MPYDQALHCLDTALDLTSDPSCAHTLADHSQRRLLNQAFFERIEIDNEDVSGAIYAQPFDNSLRAKQRFAGLAACWRNR